MDPRPPLFERLLKFLRRQGRSHEDAEDLIQEAMLRLHVYAREEPVANEEAFLRHAVVNLSIDQHRRDRTDLRHHVPVEDLDHHAPLVAPQATPEDTLHAEQRLDQLSAILDATSQRTRQIYFAHRAGYSYAEIAAHLHVSHITVRRHIARALLVIMEQPPLE
jgi:RNA polymerase sigma factor (sigma-70 family)